MPSARTTDPETSHLAAASIDGDHLRRSQAAVLRVLGALGPSTDGTLTHAYLQLAEDDAVPMQSSSGIRTRRHELVRLGRVLDSGHRQQTPSGRRAIVWAVSAR